MKSLMQEASSIMKAIEKAWVAAGKPHDFSIKIFEEAQHNFIGMTTKAAKIGIFFGQQEDVKEAREVKGRERRTSTSEPKVSDRKMRHHDKVQEEKKIEKKEEVVTRQPTHVDNVIWTDQMTSFVKTWLEGALEALQTDVKFSLEPQNYYLRCTFEKQVTSSAEQDRILFRSFSLLILQALKKDLHRPLRGFKIVLLSK